MNQKISRNDPCPCGSGKKYKKCCGVQDAVSITSLLESEIDELQKRMIYFAIDHYLKEIEKAFADYQEYFYTEDETERDFYQFVHAIWFSLFMELDDGETILDKFIAYESGKIKRPKLKEILESWTEPKAIAGKVIHSQGNQLTVEDSFSAKVYEAVTVGEQLHIEEGVFFIGFLLPFDQKYVFYPAPFDLENLPAEQALEYIKYMGQNAGYDSPQAFLTDFFMEIMNDLPTIGGEFEVDEIEWTSPIYKEVAEIYRNRMEILEVPKQIVDAGIFLWSIFCQKKQKRIQNPDLYVAALHYLIATVLPFGKIYTQKELANIYGVSASSISSIFSEMESHLSKEISDLSEMVFGQENDHQTDELKFKSEGSLV